MVGVYRADALLLIEGCCFTGAEKRAWACPARADAPGIGYNTSLATFAEGIADVIRLQGYRPAAQCIAGGNNRYAGREEEGGLDSAAATEHDQGIQAMCY